MIRILVQIDDAGMAVNVGGDVHTTFKSFDVDIPELEKYLHDAVGTYSHANVIGVELLDVEPPQAKELKE